MSIDVDDNANAERRGIKSIETGMRVIEVLCKEGRAMSLKALAKASGLPASNCHRYCVSFVRTGYLKQDIKSGRYDLGRSLLEGGLATMARIDPVSVATDALISIVEKTGHTGLLAIWAEKGPIIIRWIAGRAAVRTSISTGSSVPLFTSATGLIFLAYLSKRQTAEVAEREGQTYSNHEKLIARIRKTGIAQVSGTHIPGLTAVSSPVLDSYGEASSALTLIAAHKGIEKSAIQCLRSEAEQASAELGWSNS